MVAEKQDSDSERSGKDIDVTIYPQTPTGNHVTSMSHISFNTLIPEPHSCHNCPMKSTFMRTVSFLQFKFIICYGAEPHVR